MPIPWRFTRAQFKLALSASLRALGLSSVDLYQIHWPYGSLDRWTEAQIEAFEAGLIRAAGVSNYQADQMRHAHELLGKHNMLLASNQVHYSLLTRDPERNGVFDVCRELGITLIAYSPLEMGMLTGKYTPENAPKGYRNRQYNATYLSSIQPLIAAMREIGVAHGGKSPSQVALNWVICKGAVPIPGAKNIKQAAENNGALGWRLTSDEVAALDAASLLVQR
jgi:aryl-alcohol dehydrogenase-like predicted oxidoreductase